MTIFIAIVVTLLLLDHLSLFWAGWTSSRKKSLRDEVQLHAIRAEREVEELRAEMKRDAARLRRELDDELFHRPERPL
jgi:hypothetical protein